jgi:NADPH:quinone reductase
LTGSSSMSALLWPNSNAPRLQNKLWSAKVSSMTVPAEMTAITISAPGAPEVLVPAQVPVPVVGANEILIKVAAAGINAPDLAQRRGTYDPPAGHSALPGLEVSGVVAAVGPQAHGFALGDPVIALCNGGGYAEYVAVPAGQALPPPRNWSLIEAAALPETWFTLTQTLLMRAGLEPGMTVLVHGGAGGIGGVAIQMAALKGARSIAVVSSPDKAAYALSLGASATINHTSEDFVARTLELTEGRGADRIIDMMGGTITARNIDAAARGGHIIILATLTAGRSELALNKLLVKQLTLSGSTLRPQTSATKAAIAQRLQSEFWLALSGPTFKRPMIRALKLAEAAQGHAMLEERNTFGKIVLVTPFGETLG